MIEGLLFVKINPFNGDIIDSSLALAFISLLHFLAYIYIISQVVVQKLNKNNFFLSLFGYAA